MSTATTETVALAPSNTHTKLPAFALCVLAAAILIGCIGWMLHKRAEASQWTHPRITRVLLDAGSGPIGGDVWKRFQVPSVANPATVRMTITWPLPGHDDRWNEASLIYSAATLLGDPSHFIIQSRADAASVVLANGCADLADSCKIRVTARAPSPFAFITAGSDAVIGGPMQGIALFLSGALLLIAVRRSWCDSDASVGSCFACGSMALSVLAVGLAFLALTISTTAFG